MRLNTLIVIVLIISLGFPHCSKEKGESEEKGTFRIGTFSQPPKDLHPFSGLQGVAKLQVYDYLIWSFWNNKSEFKRKPSLIEHYEVSDNGKECIVRLRSNVYFHNGSLMTSKDVIYTYKLLRNPKKFKFLSLNQPLNIHVDYVDDLTIRMRSDANIDWKVILTNSVLNAEYERKWGNKSFDNYTPMGTGPYRFVSYDKNEKVITLKRFDDFWAGSAQLSMIEIHYFSDPETASLAMLEGQIDYLMELSPEDRVNLGKNPNIKIFKFPSVDTYQILLNTKKPFLKDRHVRRALSLLIDRKAIVGDPLSLNGGGLASDAPLHFSQPYTDPVAGESDPEKAFNLLAEAGWRKKEGRLRSNGNSFHIEILISKHNLHLLRVLRHVVSRWEQAGITCTVRDYDFATLWEMGGKSDYDAIFTELRDAEELKSNSIYFKSGSDLNLTKINDTVLGDLFAKLKSGTVTSHSIKKEIQQRIVYQSPIIVLYYQISISALRKGFYDLEISILKDPYGLYYLADDAR